MQDLDYLLEACRLAALIFLNRIFHGFLTRCFIFVQLRCQLKELLLEKESQIVHEIYPLMQRGYYTWALFLGGIHSLEDEDITFFAKCIATSTQIWQVQGFGSWSEILIRIKRVCWTNSLQITDCEEFVEQVERFIRSSDVA